MFFYYTYLLLTIITFGIASIFMMAWLQRKSMAFVHFKEIDDSFNSTNLLSKRV